MGLVWYYAHCNPAMSQLGRRTLQRIMAAMITIMNPARATQARSTPAATVPVGTADRYEPRCSG